MPAPFSPLSRQPIQTRYPNESFVVRGPGEADIYIYFIYIYKSPRDPSFCLYVHVHGLCARWLYQRRRIIQFYPETTHLYAFVWLNLSPPPRRFLSPSRPDFHPVRLFILPPVLLSFPSVSLRYRPPSPLPLVSTLDTNAVSCFNFPSPRKTERRARHPPCPIPPRRFHFSLSLTPVQSDLLSATPLVKRFHSPIDK